MKRSKYIYGVITFFLVLLAACGQAGVDVTQVADHKIDSKYHYPIQEVVDDEIFTRMIEGELVPIEVKRGIGGEGGYLQETSNNTEVISQCIEALKKIKIQKVITDPEEMICIIDGVVDYIFVMEDGTELVLGTDLSTYVRKNGVEYVLEETEALRSLVIAQDEDSDIPGMVSLMEEDYTPRTEIADDYIAVFHGGSGELTYQTYIYKMDNGASNYGFEYIYSEIYGMTAQTLKERIITSGCVMWTDDVFIIAKENGTYDYVTIPGDNTVYSTDRFAEMFLMN